VAQVETAAYSLSGWMLDFFASGEVVGRDGNRSPIAAPHGAFPCQGEDRWCTIACHEDADWQRLVAAIGAPSWATDARYATAAGRKQHEDALEERLASWTRERTAEEVVALLQGAGVEAGVVETCRNLNADPQLAQRGHFQPVQHEVLGEHTCEKLGYDLSGTPAKIERPGSMLGEDSGCVYRNLLGLSDIEIAALTSDGVLR
jgi:crotonobetainyl-CoA:carnitine CoA-transferase CaiB-like acyl-CoA transferase